jgi:hypothetical protein
MFFSLRSSFAFSCFVERYMGYYGPDYRLHISKSNMQDLNDPVTLKRIEERVIENLRDLRVKPSAFGDIRGATFAPMFGQREEDLDNANPDERLPVVLQDVLQVDRRELATGDGAAIDH